MCTYGSVDSTKPNADATRMWKFEATTNSLYTLYELAVTHQGGLFVVVDPVQSSWKWVL